MSDFYRDQPRVQELEGKLIALAQEIPGVIEPHGCSYDQYNDFKINFGHDSSRHPTNSYFFEYRPNGSTLRTWSSGLGYDMPDVVMDHLKSRFPSAVYRHERGVGTGFHDFIGVQETELPK